MQDQPRFLTILLLLAGAAFSAGSAAAGDWYLTVGPGGITRQEIKVYLVRYRREAKKTGQALTDDDLRRVIARAVQEELLFQGALAEKLHLEDEHIRRRILGEYRAHHTVGRINPNFFSDRERMAYYRAHPEEFTTPVRVKLRVLRASPGESKGRARLEAARRRPGSEKAWIEGGWKSAGEILTGTLKQADRARVFALGKGECSELLTDRFGLVFLFQVTAREEPRLLSFKEARARITHRLIQARQKQYGRELKKKLADRYGGKGDEEERLLQAALAAKAHRSWHIRQRVINHYLGAKEKKGLTREQLLESLRRRFPVALPPK